MALHLHLILTVLPLLINPLNNSLPQSIHLNSLRIAIISIQRYYILNKKNIFSPSLSVHTPVPGAVRYLTLLRIASRPPLPRIANRPRLPTDCPRPGIRSGILSRPSATLRLSCLHEWLVAVQRGRSVRLHTAVTAFLLASGQGYQHNGSKYYSFHTSKIHYLSEPRNYSPFSKSVIGFNVPPCGMYRLASAIGAAASVLPSLFLCVNTA